MRWLRQFATPSGLAGFDLTRHHVGDHDPAATTTWPARLTALLHRRAGTSGQAPLYLVTSGHYPVCWLDHDGIVSTVEPGEAALTQAQRRHQQLAVQSLRDLARPALARLADLRDIRDGRRHDVEDGHCRPDQAPTVRVAHPELPSRAWWVPITQDPAESARRLAAATGSDQPLIITACGCGRYGAQAHRLDLGLLCAITRVATTHRVKPAVVGDFAAAEDALAGLLTAEHLDTRFADRYVGTFANHSAYAAFRLDETGWEQTLRNLGALRFFDAAAYTDWLFAEQVHHAHAGDDGIAVFRRRTDR